MIIPLDNKTNDNINDHKTNDNTTDHKTNDNINDHNTNVDINDMNDKVSDDDVSRMYLPLENVLMIWWLKKPNKTMVANFKAPVSFSFTNYKLSVAWPSIKGGGRPWTPFKNLRST